MLLDVYSFQQQCSCAFDATDASVVGLMLWYIFLSDMGVEMIGALIV